MKTSLIGREYRIKAEIFKGCIAAGEKYGHSCKRSLAEWESIFMADGFTDKFLKIDKLPEMFRDDLQTWWGETWWGVDRDASIFLWL